MDTSASCIEPPARQSPNRLAQIFRYEVGTILIKWEVRTKKFVRRAGMPKRYTPVTAAADLERAIPAITQKMLGQQLKAMEADGIVLRTAYAQVPPKVEYRLTSWGQSLCPALDAILKWADRRPAHVRKVSETRRPKDASSARPRMLPSDGQTGSNS